jgi:hypothetical protein
MSRRRYRLVAVATAALALGAAPFSAASAQSGRQGFTAARKAVVHLRIPHAVRITAPALCGFIRCYRLDEPSVQAARIGPQVVTELGAKTKTIDAVLRAGWAAQERLLKKSGLPDSLGPPYGCTTINSRSLGRVANCSYPGVLDGHLIIVFSGPYIPVPRKGLTTRRRIQIATGSSLISISLNASPLRAVAGSATATP